MVGKSVVKWADWPSREFGRHNFFVTSFFSENRRVFAPHFGFVFYRGFISRHLARRTECKRNNANKNKKEEKYQRQQEKYIRGCATEIWRLTGDSQSCAFNFETWSALDLALFCCNVTCTRRNSWNWVETKGSSIFPRSFFLSQHPILRQFFVLFKRTNNLLKTSCLQVFAFIYSSTPEQIERRSSNLVHHLLSSQIGWIQFSLPFLSPMKFHHPTL